MKMKTPQSLFGTALLTLVGCVAAAGSAQAVTYNDGDLFLGFRATGGTGASLDYLIDIGQASLYRDATSSFVLNTSGPNIGNIGADLTALFGSGWSSRSDVLWEVIGTQKLASGLDATNTLYASKGETVFGTPESAWAARTNSSQGGQTTKIGSTGMAGAYTSGTNTANSPVGVIQNDSDANSYNSFQSNIAGNSNVAFGNYSSAIEGNFGGGPSGTALDLFRATNTTTGSSPHTSDLGFFTADSSGNITFNVASVPEPASLTMLGLGGCFLGLVRRRKSLA